MPSIGPPQRVHGNAYPVPTASAPARRTAAAATTGDPANAAPVGLEDGGDGSHRGEQGGESGRAG